MLIFLTKLSMIAMLAGLCIDVSEYFDEPTLGRMLFLNGVFAFFAIAIMRMPI